MTSPSDNAFSEPSTAERLVAAAGEVFALKGQAATVREICKAAGCSVAAVNYYFGDKQQLYVRCVEAACERKQRLFPFPPLDPAGSPHELLRVFLRAIAQRMVSASDMPWQNTLMLREIIEPSEAVAEKLQAYIQPDFQRLVSLLSKLLDSRSGNEELRDALATQILARCMFLRTGRGVRKILGLDTNTNEDPERYADALCDSILAQIDAAHRALPQKALTEGGGVSGPATWPPSSIAPH